MIGMTGNELRALRIKSGLLQNKFYMTVDYQPSNGCLVENYYGEKQIPKRLEKDVRRKYKKLLEEE